MQVSKVGAFTGLLLPEVGQATLRKKRQLCSRQGSLLGHCWKGHGAVPPPGSSTCVGSMESLMEHCGIAGSIANPTQRHQFLRWQQWQEKCTALLRSLRPVFTALISSADGGVR